MLKTPHPKNNAVSKIMPPALLASGIIAAMMVANPAYAHKLISHDGEHTDFDSALQIPDHHTSWAVYDNLGAGEAKFYAFDAERGDSFYAGISVPKMGGLEEYSPSLFLVRPAGFEEQPGPFEDWPNAEKFEYGGEFPGNEFYEPFGQVTYWDRQEVRTPPSRRRKILHRCDGRERPGRKIRSLDRHRRRFFGRKPPSGSARGVA